MRRFPTPFHAICAFPLANRAFAHCEGLDGPVVPARVALETANVNHALIWVQAADRTQIRRAFTETLSQRKLDTGAEAYVTLLHYVEIYEAAEGVREPER